MATIKELTERRADLEAALSKVRQELAARAGEVDPPEAPAAKKTTAK
jgi:hypothetical protein